MHRLSLRSSIVIEFRLFTVYGCELSVYGLSYEVPNKYLQGEGLQKNT